MSDLDVQPISAGVCRECKCDVLGEWRGDGYGGHFVAAQGPEHESWCHLHDGDDEDDHEAP